MIICGINRLCTWQEEDELPPWARREELQKLQAADGQELPFGVYLIGSALVSIAAVSTTHVNQAEPLLMNPCCSSIHCIAYLQVGSIFEWINKNPIFGVLPPSSALYTPILGFFAVTGFPTAGKMQWYVMACCTAYAR